MYEGVCAEHNTSDQDLLSCTYKHQLEKFHTIHLYFLKQDCYAEAKFVVLESKGQPYLKPPCTNNSPKLPLAMQI